MQSAQILTDSTFLPFIVGLSALLGACIGSFISLLTYRLPRDQKIGATRSQCPNCSTVLRAPDLVPVFSWILMRGRSRCCLKAISIRYPLTEIACGVGAAAIVWQYGLGWQALALCGLWWSIISIVVTDLEHYIILDEVQIAIGLFGLLYGWSQGDGWQDMGIAACIGAAIGLTLKYGFILLRHKDGLGMGDVKFLFVAGIWLASAANFVPFLFFSGVLGILSGIVWKLMGQGERFPFGPALAFALLVCVIFPHMADGFWQLYGLVEQ